jgi:hypothetical protein
LLTVLDWREREMILEFLEVLAFCSVTPGTSDLSHLAEDSLDPFLTTCTAEAGEKSDSYRCFQVFESDDDRCVLRVVAKDLRTVEKTERANTGATARGGSPV